jgi:protease IV
MDYPASNAPHSPAPPPLPPPAYSQARRGPPPGRRGGLWIVVAILLAGLLGLSLLVNLQQFLGGVTGRSTRLAAGPRDMEEVILEHNRSRHKIAIVEISGMIMGDALNRRGFGMVSQVRDQLLRAAQDDAVRGVVLRIYSPGGEVLASDEISQLIRDFQDETSKPVVASMGAVAASGGYYVAAPCQWIVANELTITGSIGVIMQGYNYRGLLDKLGVHPQVYKSGKFKDMFGPARSAEEIPEEERLMIQELVDQTYQRFKEVVREGRTIADHTNGDTGRPLASGWETYADGRILSGLQAWEHGFVDELGNLDTAVRRVYQLTGIPDANLIRYQRPLDFGSLFRLFSESESRSVKIDIGVEAPRLNPGTLYFLPTALPF